MALTDNLLFYYACEENAANTVVTDAVASFDATAAANTNTMSTTGKISNGFNFNGSSDDITTDSNLGISGAGARSVSFWHNISSTSNAGFFASGAFTTNNLFDIIVFSNAYFINAYGANDWATGVTPTTGSYQHVVVTYDGTNLELYVNGSSAAGPVSRTLNTTNTTGKLGKRTNNSNLLSGDLDEVGVWTRELTSAEVSELYNGGSGLGYPFSSTPEWYINFQ